MKKSRVEYYLQAKYEVEDQLHQIARTYNYYFPKDRIPEYPSNYRIEGNSFFIDWDEYARSCHIGSETREFPLSLLWNDNLGNYFKSSKEEKEKIEQEQNEIRERNEQLKKEAHDRELYEKLKQKYEKQGD